MTAMLIHGNKERVPKGVVIVDSIEYHKNGGLARKETIHVPGTRKGWV